MNDAAVIRLTDRQRDALRLYYENLSIKEIAQSLGSTPAAITERLRDARRILGAGRSMEAARILADHEGYTRAVDSESGLASIRSIDQHDEWKQQDNPAAARTDRYRFSLLQRLGIILIGAVGFVALSGAVLVGVYALTYVFKTEKISIADQPYAR